MGASPHLRWVAIAAALWLAAATPAVAQSPSGPDAAPGASSGGPRPDPAPVKSKPAATVKRYVAPAAAATTQTPARSTPSPATTTAAPARRATPAPHRAKHAASRRKHDAPAKAKAKATPTSHRTAARVPTLPRLVPVRLVAPTTDPDAGRARKLAAGALSLLILAFASAMLLAFTARVERRRVAR